MTTDPNRLVPAEPIAPQATQDVFEQSQSPSQQAPAPQQAPPQAPPRPQVVKKPTEAPSVAPAAKLQVIDYAGGKILELDRSVHFHKFLATLRGHEGRFNDLEQAKLWMRSINVHQGYNEHGKRG